MAHENLPWSLIDERERADDPRFWPAAELSEATFEGALIVDVDLSAAELIDATLSDCTLARLDLRDGQIQGATFKNCIIYRCDMRRAQFENATFENVTFDRCDLSNTNFSGASGKNIVFARCEAPNSDFSNASFTGRFFMTDVEGANFDDASLDNCPFVRCHIKETTPEAPLSACIADGIPASERQAEFNAPWFLVAGTRAEKPGDGDLHNTFFFDADLSGTDFSGRALRDTHFVRCKLDEANFTGSTVDNVWFWDCHVSHLNFAASTADRITLMHCRGGFDAAGSTFKIIHIEQGDHAESNLEAATIEVGSINMTDMRGSNFSHASVTVESYMTDYMGCDFGGTDVGGIAAERCHFDSGLEASEMSKSALEGNPDAGEVIGGVELRRLPALVAEAPVEPGVEDVPASSEVSDVDEAPVEEAAENRAGDEDSDARVQSSNGSDQANEESEAQDDASEEPGAQDDASEESGAQDDASEESGAQDDASEESGDEDPSTAEGEETKESVEADSEKSEPATTRGTSKESKAKSAIAKAEKDPPTGLFAKIIAFFRSLFGG